MSWVKRYIDDVCEMIAKDIFENPDIVFSTAVIEEE